MRRRIKKIAVLGSGVMGSRIACHFANIGCHVLLLDLKSKDEKQPNAVAEDALKEAIKSKPAPLYHKNFSNRIECGNFDDDLERIADCDWVMEAIIEKLDIKRSLFERIEKHRREGSIISSNTSGIPINQLAEGRSDDFRKHFLGTHFFNPPRYLQLLELIPGQDSDPELLSFLQDYGDRYLGKTVVLAKDTPAFIANRVGVFSILLIFRLMEEMELSIEEVDALTGPIVGRPKSATFRTCDVVGIDTLVKVADNLYQDCPEDESREYYKVPGFIRDMVDKGWTGDKGGQGFYKKVRGNGKKEILVLNPATMEYVERKKPRISAVGELKDVNPLTKRIKGLYSHDSKAGEFTRRFFNRIFQYVSHRIPEIADEPYKVDDAIKAGFGWEIGPFELWDELGFKKIAGGLSSKEDGLSKWCLQMMEDDKSGFYQIEGNQRQYYNPEQGSFEPIPAESEYILLDTYKEKSLLWKNKGSSLYDLGDGILCLEFHSKMNSMGQEVLTGLNKAYDLAEKEYRGLVIGNEGQNFSAGANLGMIFMLALEQEWEELNFAISYFQKTMMRARYSSIPVVAAPFNLTLGGGCELSLHADAVQASAETYIGLVEVGAGVIPGGGGTKEFALRASDDFYEGDTELPLLNERFTTIGMAKVATSAEEAYDLGILKRGRDRISMNKKRLLSDAKARAIELADLGYTQPEKRSDIKVLGRSALGGLLSGVYAMQQAGYISEHDLLIARKLAYVICGGDLSSPQQVSEDYLLNLEKEAFLSLLGEKKTLERMQSILKTGKPLRN